MADAGSADPNSINDTANDILSQPEYRVPKPGVVQRSIDWIGDQLQPVADAINRFLEWLAELLNVSAGGASGAGSGGFILGWIVLAIAAAALVWFLLRVMPRRRLGKRPTTKPTVEQRTRQRATRKQWLERAAIAEAERDFTGAVRARYRALAAGLADRRELDPDEAVTSGEHLRSFDSGPHRNDRFARATDQYEWAWFGDRPVDLVDSNEIEEIDRELIDGGRS